MPMSQRYRILSAALLTSSVLVAKSPPLSAAPSFEIVSIRPVPPNAPPLLRSQDFTPILSGGQYVDSRASLMAMISFAYNVKNPSRQLVGLPKWAKQRSFAVAAKAAQGSPVLPPSENREQVRLMLRAILAERFHLRLHTEIRKERVLNLTVVKSGLKIPEVDPPVPPAKEGFVNAAMSDRGGRMIGIKSTMAGLAMALVIFLKKPVYDQTGLKGYYDFDVRWSALDPMDTQTPGGFGAEGAGLLISTLRNQFGLDLSSAGGEVEYWVVDRVEPPTEN